METIDSAFPEFQDSVLAGKRSGDRLLATLCGMLAFLFYWLLTPHYLPPGAPAEPLQPGRNSDFVGDGSGSFRQ